MSDDLRVQVIRFNLGKNYENAKKDTVEVEENIFYSTPAVSADTVSADSTNLKPKKGLMITFAKAEDKTENVEKPEYEFIFSDVKKRHELSWGEIGEIALNSGKNFVKGMFCDENGFSLKRTAMTVGTVAVLAFAAPVAAAAGASAAVVAGIAGTAKVAGLGLAGYMTFNGGKNIIEGTQKYYDSTTEAEAKASMSQAMDGAVEVAAAVPAFGIIKGGAAKGKKMASKKAEAQQNQPAPEGAKPAAEAPKPVEEAPKAEAKPVEEAPKAEAKPVEESKPVEEAPKAEAKPVEESKPVEEAPKAEAKPVEEAPKTEQKFTEAKSLSDDKNFKEFIKALLNDNPKNKDLVKRFLEDLKIYNSPEFTEAGALKTLTESAVLLGNRVNVFAHNGKLYLSVDGAGTYSMKLKAGTKPAAEAPKAEPKPVEESKPIEEASKAETKPVEELKPVEESPKAEAKPVEEPKPVEEAPKAEEAKPAEKPAENAAVDYNKVVETEKEVKPDGTVCEYQWNAKGDILKSTSFDKDGKFNCETNSKYDSNGKKIEHNFKGADGYENTELYNNGVVEKIKTKGPLGEDELTRVGDGIYEGIRTKEDGTQVKIRFDYITYKTTELGPVEAPKAAEQAPKAAETKPTEAKPAAGTEENPISLNDEEGRLLLIAKLKELYPDTLGKNADSHCKTGGSIFELGITLQDLGVGCSSDWQTINKITLKDGTVFAYKFQGTAENPICLSTKDTFLHGDHSKELRVLFNKCMELYPDAPFARSQQEYYFEDITRLIDQANQFGIEVVKVADDITQLILKDGTVFNIQIK